MEVDSSKIIGAPNPYDLIHVELVRDPEKIFETEEYRPPRITQPALNLTVTQQILEKEYGSGLTYLGVGGSYAKGTFGVGSDLDVIAIVKDPLGVPSSIPDGVHVTLMSEDHMKEFLLHGDILRTNTFRLSRPLVDNGIEHIRDIVPDRDLAIPYLAKKIRYTYHSSITLSKLVSKYKSTVLHTLGSIDEAEQQLEQKIMFDDEHLRNIILGNQQARRFYTVVETYLDASLDKLWFSASDTAALHNFIENDTILDLPEILQFAEETDASWGEYLQRLFAHKKQTRKREHVITEAELRYAIEENKRWMDKYLSSSV